MKPLRTQIPKAQKILTNHQTFFALLGSARMKALCKMLVKLAPAIEVKITFITLGAKKAMFA